MSDRNYYYLLIILSATMLSPFNFIVYGIIIALLILNFAKKEFAEEIGERVRKNKQTWLPAFIYIITVVYFFISKNQKSALGYLSAYLPYLFPFVINLGPSVSQRQFKTIMRASIIGLVLSISACIVYGFADILITNQTHIFIEDARYHKLSSFGLTRLFTSWHPTYAGTFAAWALTFLIAYRIYHKGNSLFKPVVELSMGVILLSAIILLNSIAAIIGLVIGLIIVFTQLLIRKRVKPILIAGFIAIIMILGSLIIIINPFANAKIESLKTKEFVITDQENDRNFLTLRIAKWVSHLEIFEKNPFFGVTPADIKKERKDIYLKHQFNYLALHNYNAHNQYIEILCRFGILGLIILISFMAYPLFLNQTSPLYAPFISISATIFLTESFLERQQGILAFMCLFALLLNCQKNN